MQPAVIALTFLATAVPAFAQTAPMSGGTAARATSTASAEASAAAIEACTASTGTFLDRLEKGDYNGATSNFDEAMRSGLPAGKLGQVWQSIGAQFGKLKSRDVPQNVMYQGYAVITVPLHFEKGDLAARLSCGRGGKFNGFHVLPLPAAEPATSSSSR